MAVDVWKDREVANAFFSERSLLIPDRQLEVMRWVVRFACPQVHRRRYHGFNTLEATHETAQEI